MPPSPSSPPLAAPKRSTACPSPSAQNFFLLAGPNKISVVVLKHQGVGGKHPKEPGKFYFQARLRSQYPQKHIFSGWATREQVVEKVRSALSYEGEIIEDSSAITRSPHHSRGTTSSFNSATNAVSSTSAPGATQVEKDKEKKKRTTFVIHQHQVPKQISSAPSKLLPNLPESQTVQPSSPSPSPSDALSSLPLKARLKRRHALESEIVAKEEEGSSLTEGGFGPTHSSKKLKSKEETASAAPISLPPLTSQLSPKSSPKSSSPSSNFQGLNVLAMVGSESLPSIPFGFKPEATSIPPGFPMLSPYPSFSGFPSGLPNVPPFLYYPPGPSYLPFPGDQGTSYPTPLSYQHWYSAQGLGTPSFLLGPGVQESFHFEKRSSEQEGKTSQELETLAFLANLKSQSDLHK